MIRERSGFELPLLMIGAFRSLIDELHAELADAGHPGVRPVHGFALQAVGADGVTVSELGRRLEVSKQAAAKTVAVLEGLGYVAREPHERDARSLVVRRTVRGTEMLHLSSLIFARQRAGLRRRFGAARLAQMEDDLADISGREPSARRLAGIQGWFG